MGNYTSDLSNSTIQLQTQRLHWAHHLLAQVLNEKLDQQQRLKKEGLTSDGITGVIFRVFSRENLIMYPEIPFVAKKQKKTKKVRNFPRARHWNSNHFEVVSFHNFHDQDSHSTATATKSSFENNRQRQVFAWLAHLNKSWSFVLFLLPFKKCWKDVLSNMLRSVKVL